MTVYSGITSQRDNGLVLLSHGHTFHNTDYSFLAKALVSRGYIVISIQHELPTDEPLPPSKKGRMNVLSRGADNLFFVIGELKKNYSTLYNNHISLIGHSMGGDISMLFTQGHPGYVRSVISLDHCRFPIPLLHYPKILSLRSSDQSADPGVLPTAEEQKKYAIQIIPLPNTGHNEMNDYGSMEQKELITRCIIGFLINQQE